MTSNFSQLHTLKKINNQKYQDAAQQFRSGKLVNTVLTNVVSTVLTNLQLNPCGAVTVQKHQLANT